VPRRFLQLELEQLRLAIAAFKEACVGLAEDKFSVSASLLEKMVADFVLLEIVDGADDYSVIAGNCIAYLREGLGERLEQTE